MPDHFLAITICEKGLAESKRPPICDGCNDPIANLGICANCQKPKEDHIQARFVPNYYLCRNNEFHTHYEELYLINALILDQAEEGLFHSVQCEKCRLKCFLKLPVVKEDKEDKDTKLAVRATLSQDPVFLSMDQDGNWSVS